MKIKILKCGAYAFDPTGIPMTELEEEDIGTVMDFEKSQARMLIDDKWARELNDEEIDELESESENGDEDPDPDEGGKDSDEDEDEDKEPGEDDPTTDEIDDVDDYLNKLIADKEEGEAKQILQDWGKTRLDITVSKSNKIENMIAKLVESV